MKNNVKVVQIEDSWPDGIEVQVEGAVDSTASQATTSSGKPWPGGLEVVQVQVVSKTPAATARDKAGLWLVQALVLFLAVFIVYGMLTSDRETLDGAFQLVTYGLMAAIGWALGRQSRGSDSTEQ